MRASAKTKREVKDRQYPFLRRNRNGSLPAFLQAFETSGLTTGNPLNHGTPSVVIGLIIDGKDVGCGGQREAGSLMLGRS